MNIHYIALSSITTAYKAQSFLEKMGVKSHLTKTPKEHNSCGCGYSLKIVDRTARRSNRYYDHSSHFAHQSFDRQDFGHSVDHPALFDIEQTVRILMEEGIRVDGTYTMPAEE